MRVVLVLSLAVVAVTGYGGGYGGGGGCNSGCSGGGGQSLPQQTTSSCSGSGCGSHGGGGSIGGGSSGGVGGSGGSGNGYWWQGNNSPFNRPGSHGTASSSTGGNSQPGRPVGQQQNPFVQRPPQPQQGYVQPRPTQGTSPIQVPSSQNLVQPPMGICPADFVCVQWQLCRNGFVIVDGTGSINKQIKQIPAQVASRYQSCGGDMVCCGVPAGGHSSIPASRPNQPQILAPAPLPPRPAPQPARPISLPARPTPQPARPAPQPARPISIPARPAPQPARPAPQPARPSGGYGNPPVHSPARPAPQPARPISLPARPAPQPARPISIPARPAPQPARPAPQPGRPSSGGYGRPSTPQNPQPTFVNPSPSRPAPSRPAPQAPISNPIGLVSPPSPQPMGMMPGMMGMMPMRGGSCSAGTYCIQPDRCNPYTGFIIQNPSQLMAVWPDAPTVPLLPCFVPGGGIQNGVCCQQPHPNAGGAD